VRKKKVEKIEAYIRKYIDKHYPTYIQNMVNTRCANLEEVNTWVLLRTLENDMKFVRPHLEALMGTVNSMWGLPPFKPYRGKR
jgi:hypothetical protein